MDKMNTWTWLLPLLSGAFGAIIGTYGGARVLSWRQESKIRNVREIAIKALKIFKSYARQHKTYSEAENEFNKELNLSEKRAVVVALHKQGIPFKVPTTDTLNVKALRFCDSIVDEEEVNAIITQIESGNCDNLFYEDIETYFTSNLRLYAVRSVGKKYVETVLSKSHIDKDDLTMIKYPIDWFKEFTPGELQTILVMHMRLANTDYFTKEGNSDMNAIKTLLREIEIGLWDNYLFFEFESFQNIKAQSNLANAVQTAITTQQMMNNNK